MQDGWTAAMWASNGGHEGALGLLIAAGVDLSVQDKVIDRLTMRGEGYVGM